MTAQALPALTPDSLALVRCLEDELAKYPQHIPVTEHLFHAGMYVRTIKLIAGQAITGALMRRATLLIVQGNTNIYTGNDILKVRGYRVLAGQAGRKSVFYAYGEVYLTMAFPTEAKTVEEAEREFTDEYARLASHNGDNDVVITGE